MRAPPQDFPMHRKRGKVRDKKEGGLVDRSFVFSFVCVCVVAHLCVCVCVLI